MPTFTTNYSIPKPVPGADADTWGAALNSGMDIIDTQLAGRVSGASALSTVGSVPFVTAAGVLGQSANLFWDNANGRLGVGTNAPQRTLHVQTSGTTVSALVQNASGQANLTFQGTTFGQFENTVGDLFFTNNSAAGHLIFRVNGTEGMRLASTSRNFLLGTTTDDGTSRLQVNGNLIVNGGNALRLQNAAGNQFASMILNSEADVTLNYPLKLGSSNSVSTGFTLAVHNGTPTTGSTSFVVRAGAGQSGNLQTWQNSAGSSIGFIASNGEASNVTWRDTSNGAYLRNTDLLVRASFAHIWNSGTTYNGGANDLSLSRASANTLQVGDGGANALGTLNAARVNLGTNATVPLLIGGTGVLSTLTLRSTSGVGTTGADIIFQTGSNGATEVMRLQNNGFAGLGTAAIATKLDIRGTSATTGSTVQIVGIGVSSLMLGQDADGGVIRGQGGNSTLRFLVGGAGDNAAAAAGTEAMRIVSNGNVGIGMVNPAYQLQLSTDSAAKPSTNTWTIASDERLKTVLGDYEKGLDAICALRPVRYQYNGLGGMPADGKEHISILAQEAQEVFPECIGTFVGKLHEDDEEETELLNYNGHAVTFAFINAIKELKARIETLEAAQK